MCSPGVTSVTRIGLRRRDARERRAMDDFTRDGPRALGPWAVAHDETVMRRQSVKHDDGGAPETPGWARVAVCFEIATGEAGGADGPSAIVSTDAPTDAGLGLAARAGEAWAGEAPCRRRLRFVLGLCQRVLMERGGRRAPRAVINRDGDATPRALGARSLPANRRLRLVPPRWSRLARGRRRRRVPLRGLEATDNGEAATGASGLQLSGAGGVSVEL
jgi:hypothetical protein